MNAEIHSTIPNDFGRERVGFFRVGRKLRKVWIGASRVGCPKVNLQVAVLSITRQRISRVGGPNTMATGPTA